MSTMTVAPAPAPAPSAGPSSEVAGGPESGEEFRNALSASVEETDAEQAASETAAPEGATATSPEPAAPLENTAPPAALLAAVAAQAAAAAPEAAETDVPVSAPTSAPATAKSSDLDASIAQTTVTSAPQPVAATADETVPAPQVTPLSLSAPGETNPGTTDAQAANPAAQSPAVDPAASPEGASDASANAVVQAGDAKAGAAGSPSSYVPSQAATTTESTATSTQLNSATKQPVNPTVAQVIEGIDKVLSSGSPRAGVQHLTIRLNPEYLGELTVALRTTEAGVSVSFRGGAEAMAAVAAGGADLNRALASLGLAGADVTVTDWGTSNGGDQREQAGGQREQSAGPRTTSAEAPIPAPRRSTEPAGSTSTRRLDVTV